MATLAQAILVLYPSAKVVTDWLVARDKNGVERIVTWNPSLGVQPTLAQVSAVTDAQVAAAQASSLRSQAMTLFLADKSPVAEAVRGLALTLLDRINALEAELQTLRNAVRAVAPTVPAVVYPQYTAQQLKDAVQAKITSGASD